MSARRRDPGAGPQAARDAAARDDGPADADDDATLKSQSIVIAISLIMSYRVHQHSYMCNVVIFIFTPLL